MENTNKKCGSSLLEVLMSISIAGITMASIIQGHIFNYTRVEWTLYSSAAQCSIFQKSEQLRSAKWDSLSYPVIDEIKTSNFPPQVVELDIPV